MCVHVYKLFFSLTFYISLRYGTIILLSYEEWEKTEKCRESVIFFHCRFYAVAFPSYQVLSDGDHEHKNDSMIHFYDEATKTNVFV